MPKVRVYKKGEKGKAVAVSCKIGGRKSKTGVAGLSVKNIIAAIEHGGRNRDKTKLNAELRKRNIATV